MIAPDGNLDTEAAVPDSARPIESDRPIQLRQERVVELVEELKDEPESLDMKVQQAERN